MTAHRISSEPHMRAVLLIFLAISRPLFAAEADGLIGVWNSSHGK
jgi:hypothetical protein